MATKWKIVISSFDGTYNPENSESFTLLDAPLENGCSMEQMQQISELARLAYDEGHLDGRTGKHREIALGKACYDLPWRGEEEKA